MSCVAHKLAVLSPFVDVDSVWKHVDTGVFWLEIVFHFFKPDCVFSFCSFFSKSEAAPSVIDSHVL